MSQELVQDPNAYVRTTVNDDATLVTPANTPTHLIHLGVDAKTLTIPDGEVDGQILRIAVTGASAPGYTVDIHMTADGSHDTLSLVVDQYVVLQWCLLDTTTKNPRAWAAVGSNALP